MDKNKKPDLPFSIAIIEGPDRKVSAHTCFGRESLSLDGFEEGTRLMIEIRLKGEGYNAEGIIAFLKALHQISDGEGLYQNFCGLLADAIEETREGVIKTELANCKRSVPPSGGN